MRELYSRAKYLIYFMTCGLSPDTPPYTLKPTSGSGFGRSSWNRLVTWSKSHRQARFPWITGRLTTIRQWYYPWFQRIHGAYRHTGSHRGTGRATRKGNRLIKQQISVAQANQRIFQDLMNADSGLVGLGTYAPGSRAYRKLAWSRLSHEAMMTQTLIRPRIPVEDRYDSVP